MIFRTLGIVTVVLIAAQLFFTPHHGLSFSPSGNPKGVPVVGIVSTDEVLQLIHEGKRVVFVDAREKQEFAEAHIPGAINLTLREINDMAPRLIGQADLVIAYCLKDFRGYEVAKALAEAGVPRLATLKISGLNGWRAEGLPLYTPGKNSEAEAIAHLRQCAALPVICRKSNKS